MSFDESLRRELLRECVARQRAGNSGRDSAAAAMIIRDMIIIVLVLAAAGPSRQGHGVADSENSVASVQLSLSKA
jgi:hypothetical protein